MRYQTKFTPGIFALMLSGIFSSGVNAEENIIYKQVRPNGTVFYTDKPNPQAKTEKQLKMEIPVVPYSMPSSSTSNDTNGLPVPGSAIPNLPPLPGSSAKATSGSGKLRAAQEKYDAAVAARNDGANQREGDRVRNANGSFRISEAYYKRQSDLNAAVKKAEEELNNSK